MRRFFNLLMLAVALFGFFVFNGKPLRASTLWGDLKPGGYRVGFKTIFTYDLSRPSIGDESGKIERSGRGRQMQINVWYPAGAPRGSALMRFEEYVHLLLQEVDFAPLSGMGQKQASVDKFLENPVELGGEAASIRPRLPELMKMETAAVRDAKPARGRFPLIIFPAYRTPAIQSIMCEYLASHGFVVASTGLKGTLEVEPEISLTGVETNSMDLQFVIGTLKTFPMVDGEKLALMGLGFASSGCLALLTRNTDVDAIISLDGGILSSFEDRLLKRTPYYDLSAIRVPLLAIYSPHPDINPAFLDQYKYSTRHIVHFPRMSEFYFLNYGMIERFVPGIIGKTPGDTKTGFEWASRYCMNFLKAYLYGDDGSMAFLQNKPATNLVPEGLLTVSLKKGLRAPPTLPELKAMIRESGFQRVVALYRQLRQDDPQPFSQERLADLFSWLAYRRDPEWKARRELALMRVESYPQSTRAHFTLAGVALQLGEKELARKHYAEALRLLESDPDPVMDYSMRRRIEQGARQNLKNLES